MTSDFGWLSRYECSISKWITTNSNINNSSMQIRKAVHTNILLKNHFAMNALLWRRAEIDPEGFHGRIIIAKALGVETSSKVSVVLKRPCTPPTRKTLDEREPASKNTERWKRWPGRGVLRGRDRFEPMLVLALFINNSSKSPKSPKSSKLKLQAAPSRL